MDGYFSESGENRAVQHVKDDVFSSKASGIKPSYRKVDATQRVLSSIGLSESVGVKCVC